MMTGPLVIGEILWWAPHDPRAFERVKVSAIQEKDGTVYVQTENARTHVKYWNREVRVLALCKREEKRKSTPKGAAVCAG